MVDPREWHGKAVEKAAYVLWCRTNGALGAADLLEIILPVFKAGQKSARDKLRRKPVTERRRKK